VAATWDDVSEIARGLPQTTEGIRFGDPVWRVGKDGFVWVRPLRAKDRDELGADGRTGVIIGASTVDEGEKLALIDEDPHAFFTIPHFDGYSAILVDLDHVAPKRLREVVTDAWLARASKRLVADYLADGGS
jgi:hypothetical protein